MTTNPSPEPLDDDVEGHGIPSIDPREMDKCAAAPKNEIPRPS